jgi:HD superfamily phosphohydrolase
VKFETKKIINDPVYGIINLPDGILYDLISHPYFQRLRRISQLGLSNFVYPGANHTRFHHALGALHLCLETLEMFQKRGIQLSHEEAEGVAIALLLHDIGHGPFSHVLESTLTGLHHEELTLAIMEMLNQEFDSRLSLAIAIFKGEYKSNFLHQLVSGQLDLDRMDYLNRDSFFTGVAEGKIGYDRIIKMLTVVDGQLAVEEKGIYSVEKFLMARRLMYWQVYLHKTVLAVEQMLIRLLEQARKCILGGEQFLISDALLFFMLQKHKPFNPDYELVSNFLELDDYDIWWALKQFARSVDPVLSHLSNAILKRDIFKIELSKEKFSMQEVEYRIKSIENMTGYTAEVAASLVLTGTETNEMYTKGKDEIKIVMKDGSLRKFSEISDYPVNSGYVRKYFISYPKH